MSAPLRIAVTGLPPAKNEARSMFGSGHPHRGRVLALLEAARDAMTASGFTPFAPQEPIGLDVVVACPPGLAWDATNYLGGIADVLQPPPRTVELGHLGEFAAVNVYPDDRMIHQVSYRLIAADAASYKVRLRRLDSERQAS